MQVAGDQLSLRRKPISGEIYLLAFSVLSLIASCILLSARKQAWMDEIFTWKEASDPSLWHLYRAIQHGADGGQPLFYTTVWLWEKAFGNGALTLRLYSCAAVCAALLVTWMILRRYYGMWSTAFGILMFWGASSELLNQNAEARFYGLYLLTVAIAVAFYAKLTEEAKPSPLLLAGTALAQAAVVLTHILGLIYSAFILFALILSDARQRRFRWKVYLAHTSGWLALLIWVPAIRASLATGNPRGWIPMPHLHDALDAYFFEIFVEWLSAVQAHRFPILFSTARHLSQLLVMIPVAVVATRFLRRLFSRKRHRFGEREDPLLLVAFALLVMPVTLFALSHLIEPVFVPRYLLPSGVGLAILLASFANTAGADAQRSAPGIGRFLWPAFTVILLICPVSSAFVARTPYAMKTFLDVGRLDRDVSANSVVVVGWQEDFSRLMRFSNSPSRYYFLLDWPVALVGPRSSVVDYHLMRSYHDAGYYAENIKDRDAFLCSHPDFFELDSSGHSWADVSIRKMPEFEWKTVDTIDPAGGIKRTLFAVHRRGPLPFCPAQ